VRELRKAREEEQTFTVGWGREAAKGSHHQRETETATEAQVLGTCLASNPNGQFSLKKGRGEDFRYIVFRGSWCHGDDLKLNWGWEHGDICFLGQIDLQQVQHWSFQLQNFKVSSTAASSCSKNSFF